jgi:hypothetical protein
MTCGFAGLDEMAGALTRKSRRFEPPERTGLRGERKRPAGACTATIEGGDIMTKKNNPHVGSTFESWLDAEGIREDVTAAAIKEVIAEQLAAEMKKKKKKGITKARPHGRGAQPRQGSRRPHTPSARGDACGSRQGRPDASRL